MTTVLAFILMILSGLCLQAEPVRAQAGEAGSLLDPFPENDRYRVQVVGDQMADGLLEGLVEHLADEPRLQIDRKVRWLGGVMKADADQEAKAIEAALAGSAPHIAVVMLGAADRVSFRRANNRRAGVGSEEWKEEYARRLDLIMRAFRTRSVGVFWVSLPILRRPDAADDAEMINELIRSRALANGVRFIDIFESFADVDRSYNAYGPDLAGKMRLLRDQDGVHFTGSGYRKLAYFVERELKRAAAQAWDERMIPLAGSEAEQARIRPAPTVKLAPLPPSGRGAGGASAAAPKAAAKGAGAGDGVTADNSRITLKSLNAQGREESVTLEILRPAIPASVVSLLTRRESEEKPTHVGDSVMTEILGGLTVVSSVTPFGDRSGERRRGGVDQTTPLHRVLQRGESLPPKPGRADEMPWPRPEPVLDPRLSRSATAEAPAAGIDTGSVPAAPPLPIVRGRRPAASPAAARR